MPQNMQPPTDFFAQMQVSLSKIPKAFVSLFFSLSVSCPIPFLNSLSVPKSIGKIFCIFCQKKQTGSKKIFDKKGGYIHGALFAL
jgi:hypothetical protein